MSFTPKTEHKSSRSDMFSCDPRDLKVDWNKNIARNGKEPTVDDDLMSLGRSMRPKNQGGHGQLQPILVRPLNDRTLQVIGGFRRTRAALWLIESGECADFMLQCSVKRLSDSEAALGNVVENLDRKELSSLELAHAVRSLHEDYGMPLKDIAGQLHRSPIWLEKVMALTMLPPAIQESIQAGDTTVTAALELTKVPPESQLEVFDAAHDSNGKVRAQEVRNTRRQEGDQIKRTIKHLRTLLGELSGPAEHREGRYLIKCLFQFLDGEITDTQMYDEWIGIFPPPK